MIKVPGCCGLPDPELMEPQRGSLAARQVSYNRAGIGESNAFLSKGSESRVMS